MSDSIKLSAYNKHLWQIITVLFGLRTWLLIALAFVVIIILFEHATRDSFTKIGYERMHSHDGSVQV
jgi:hypothetical protein